MNEIVQPRNILMNTSIGYPWKTRLHHDLSFKEGKFILGFTFNGSNEKIGMYVDNEYWDNYIHIHTVLRAESGIKFITNVWSN